MANRVLSIESGRSLVRVLELSYKGKETKVYNSFSFSTPDSMFDGNDSLEFANILKEELNKRKISTRRAVFVINSSRMAAREIVIPAVKEGRIADLIAANASEYFPVDLSQYILVHEIIEKFTTENNKRLRLSILAIPKDIIEFYERLAKDSGLVLEGMGYTGNASKQIMLGESNIGIRILLKIDGRSSLLTIMNGSKIELQRHINYGIAEAVSIVCENGMYGRPDFAGGLKILCDNNMFTNEAENSNDDGGSDESVTGSTNVEHLIKEEIVDSLRLVSGSISRILDYYQSRRQDAKIENINVIGIGAEIAGFMDFLTSEFGIHTEKMPLIKGINITKNSGDIEHHLAAYYSCLGITLRGGNLPSIKQKKGEKTAKKESKSIRGSLVLPAAASVLLVIVAGVWFTLSYLDYNTAREENYLLTNQITDLSYIEDVERDNENTKADYDWINEAIKSTDSNNNGLRALIEQLEQKMPSSIRVISLNASAETVSLNITVNNKDSAADIIKRIREFDNVKISNISTIVETKAKDDRSEVNFSLELNYVNPNEDNAAVAEGTSTEATDEKGE